MEARRQLARAMNRPTDKTDSSVTAFPASYMIRFISAIGGLKTHVRVSSVIPFIFSFSPWALVGSLKNRFSCSHFMMSRFALNPFPTR